MRYELMLPHQIRKAIEEHWPVVLPLGVLEYHGEHMGVGMDTLAVIKMLEIVEAEMDIVILPPFYYGAASYAVAPPEGNGSVQVGGNVLAPFGEALFYSLLRVGFRNIHAIIHHQTENFAAGMPTDLAFKSAGAAGDLPLPRREERRGLVGRREDGGLLRRARGGAEPVQLDSQVHPLMTPETMADYPFDHAGQGETSLMMALCPEAVDMAEARRQHGLVHGNRRRMRRASLARKASNLIVDAAADNPARS